MRGVAELLRYLEDTAGPATVTEKLRAVFLGRQREAYGFAREADRRQSLDTVEAEAGRMQNLER